MQYVGDGNIGNLATHFARLGEGGYIKGANVAISASYNPPTNHLVAFITSAVTSLFHIYDSPAADSASKAQRETKTVKRAPKIDQNGTGKVRRMEIVFKDAVDDVAQSALEGSEFGRRVQDIC